MVTLIISLKSNQSDVGGGGKNNNARQGRNKCSAHHFQLSWKHANNDGNQILC